MSDTTTCGGCGRPVDPTLPCCTWCGFPDRRRYERSSEYEQSLAVGAHLLTRLNEAAAEKARAGAELRKAEDELLVWVNDSIGYEESPEAAIEALREVLAQWAVQKLST